jgi:hypothetical protein
VARRLPTNLAKRIQFPHTKNQCWIWTGTMSNGSGYTRVNGVKMTARRAVYRELVGEPASALYPKCEVGECVNPRHMIVKIGRQAKPRQKKTGARPWKAAGAR